MIFLYRLPILVEWCERGCALEEVVFDVLTHEIGHHFGMNEEEVLRMEGRSIESQAMPITSLDHLVLTVRDGEATRRFYVDGLGMRWTEFDGRHALSFGSQKINLHYAAASSSPRPPTRSRARATSACCTDEPLEAVQTRLAGLGFPVLEGPVERTGAVGQAPVRSTSATPTAT